MAPSQSERFTLEPEKCWMEAHTAIYSSLLQAELPKSIMDQIARSYVGSDAKYPLDPTERVLPVSPSPPPDHLNGPEYPEDHGEKLSILLEQNCTMMRRNIMVHRLGSLSLSPLNHASSPCKEIYSALVRSSHDYNAFTLGFKALLYASGTLAAPHDYSCNNVQSV
jgi:hypothetical protein